MVLGGASSKGVSVFFKMSILSTIFVHLSAERWHFSAPFQISKNSISATFPTHFPNRFPAQAPVIFSLSGGILRSRNSQSNSPHLPRHLLFQEYPSQAKPQSTPCTFSQLSALSGEIYGEILGGMLDSVYSSYARMAAQMAIQRTCTAAIKASEVLA